MNLLYKRKINVKRVAYGHQTFKKVKKNIRLPISSAMAAMPTRPSHPGTCTPYTTASVRLAELNRKMYGIQTARKN
jgi:hypothetical protein